MMEPANMKHLKCRSTSAPHVSCGDLGTGITPTRMLDEIRNSGALFELYEHIFPRSIWRCCSSVCFFLNMSNPQLVSKLAKIYEAAKQLRQALVPSEQLIAPRRRGVGGSKIAFTAPQRNEREMEQGQVVTHKQAAQQRLVSYAKKVLPFLRGRNEMPIACTSLRLDHKLCINGICIILGVSRNFLYNTRKRDAGGSFSSLLPSNENNTGQPDQSSTPTQRTSAALSIIDSAGMREKEFRRIEMRCGFPALEEMSTFPCGCAEPCFAEVPLFQLEKQYKYFIQISNNCHRRRRENKFLLNIMFWPLSNSTVWQCDRSIANLITVSEGLVGRVRKTLKSMCEKPELENRPLRDDWRQNGYSSNYHPANRMSDRVRERMENNLDMVLRPDPAGGNEAVCHVYSPEVNTHEKLRTLLLTLLDSDEGSIEKIDVSSSTLRRRIDEYLASRSLRIAFEQTDHNACPTYKTLKYATFQFFKEYKHMEKKETQLIRETEGADSTGVQERIKQLRVQIEDKKHQEAEALAEYRNHCGRDRNIRGAIKRMSDHFRARENELIHQQMFARQCPPWASIKNHATITHQDDMTKVDLPYFPESASADITRWRFDANAHVSSVNGDAVVFSHEQGTGGKNAGCILEEILLDHLVRCRGEAIKVVVSDNASVEKNWVTTVAMPQYFVDQGLASIVFIIFLENNHGKWLADMLFGQLQTRRKKTTLLSIDDLLSEFEAVNRTTGDVQGFALNPLSSIEFSEVLHSLGYETKPPKGLNFTKRNIHFAGAAAPGAKEELSSNLKRILGTSLPDEPGMVRTCSNPPAEVPQNSLPYDERYFDVPAARVTLEPSVNDGFQPEQSGLTQSEHDETQPFNAGLNVPQRSSGAEGNGIRSESSTPEVAFNVDDVPLVVPLHLEYSKGGSGVVSRNTAKSVGFNGIRFRKSPAFPELRNTKSDIMRRAWPAGLVTRERNELRLQDESPQHCSEFEKCASENWVMRRPILGIIASCGEPIARYAPRNLINALYKKGPREEFKWVPTATYSEPPVPCIEGTCTSAAIRKLSLSRDNTSHSVHVLEVLKAIFVEMGRQLTEGQESCDPWLQRRVTMPSRESIKNYHEGLSLYLKREKGYPKAPVTVKQAFKRDAEKLAKVKSSLAANGRQRDGKAKTKELNSMFEEAENTPGGLERFEYIVERGLERFSREFQTFKVQVRKFDEENGLLPH